jgi:hypothetical protein
MGFLSGLLGSNSSFHADTGVNPYAAQADDAQAQQAILQQQQFADAAGRSNGLANQSSVFNQLQGVANGQGPNPAQAMLAQATGANTATQAALMAGQRGASQNAGLIARQAAQQGGANQQAAAGQAATMQANQSLGALNQLGGLAGQQVAQQQQALSGYNAAAQGLRGQNLQAQSGANQINADTAKQNAANNAGIAGGIIGGGASALTKVKLAQGGSVIPMAAGGELSLGSGYGNNIDQQLSFNATDPNAMVKGFKDTFKPSDKAPATIAEQGPMKEVVGATGEADIGQSPFGQRAAIGGLIHAYSDGGHILEYGRNLYANGGKVDALVSPGERYLPPREVEEVAKGKKDPMKAGEKIPGKPKVGGAKNSYANDTVPKKLDEGGIVIPRSITQGKDAHKKSVEFVFAILGKPSKRK